MTSRSRRSTGRQVVVEVIAVAVSCAVALTLTAAVVGLQVQDTRASAIAASSTAKNGPISELPESIAALRSNLEGLSDYSKSPAWLAMQYIPRLGTPIRQSTAVLNAAGQVSESAAAFEGVLGEIDRPRPSSQLVPMAALARVESQAADLADAIGALSAAVDQLDPEAFPSSVRPRLEQAVSQSVGLLPQLEEIVRAMPTLMSLLGKSTPQKWFIAFQNGGESRGTGGFVGSYAIVDIADGKLTPRQVGANNDLTAKANPALLPADSRQLWGQQRLAEIYGVNLSPNYPFAGELLASLWKAQAGAPPDAVLAVDQRVTVKLIGAVGGITVDGIEVNESNALDWLTVGVYQRYGVEGKDAFVNTLVSKLMDRVVAGAVSPLQFMSAIAPEVLAGRVLLWASDAKRQADLAPSIVGGEVPDKPGPFAMAVVNNNAGNKMDTFLHTSVNYQGGECVAGGRRAKLSVELFNDPPTTLLTDDYFGRGDREQLFGLDRRADGSNRVRLAVYLPTGAFVSGSQPGSLYSGTERNHPVSMFGIELNKGQRKSVTVDFTMFGEKSMINKPPLVPAQPMLNAQQIVVTRGPTC